MKKIILIISILLMTGCYDYHELEDLAIVIGIGIDYDNAYNLTLEILESDESVIITTKGKTISEAFTNANLNSSNTLYYAHTKIIVLGEEIVTNHLENIMDYLIRTPQIHNQITPLMASNASLVLTNDNASESIAKIITNNNIDTSLESLLDKIVDERIDASINIINDELELDGLGLLKDYQLVNTLTNEETSILNVLNNTSSSHYVKLNGNECYTTINIYQNKTSTNMKTNELKLASKLEANIIEDTCSYNFQDETTYEKLEEEFTIVIQNQYESIINILKTNKIDTLGINQNYYKKTGKNLTNWYSFNITYEIDLNINKNGLVFEVN